MKSPFFYCLFTVMFFTLMYQKGFAFEISHTHPISHEGHAFNADAKDHISNLPNELKQQILTFLEPEPICQMSRVSKLWLYQMKDSFLQQLLELKCELKARQEGVLDKCAPTSTWKQTYITHQLQKRLYNNFLTIMESCQVFINLNMERIFGVQLIYPREVLEQVNKKITGDEMVNFLNNFLSSYNITNECIIISLDGAVYNTLLGSEVFFKLITHNDTRAKEYLESRRVDSPYNLAPEEMIFFFALHGIPILTRNKHSTNEFVLDVYKPKVHRAILTAQFFYEIRKFIAEYGIPLKKDINDDSVLDLGL